MSFYPSRYDEPAEFFCVNCKDWHSYEDESTVNEMCCICFIVLDGHRKQDIACDYCDESMKECIGCEVYRVFKIRGGANEIT